MFLLWRIDEVKETVSGGHVAGKRDANIVSWPWRE